MCKKIRVGRIHITVLHFTLHHHVTLHCIQVSQNSLTDIASYYFNEKGIRFLIIKMYLLLYLLLIDTEQLKKHTVGIVR